MFIREIIVEIGHKKINVRQLTTRVHNHLQDLARSQVRDHQPDQVLNHLQDLALNHLQDLAQNLRQVPAISFSAIINQEIGEIQITIITRIAAQLLQITEVLRQGLSQGLNQDLSQDLVGEVEEDDKDLFMVRINLFAAN